MDQYVENRQKEILWNVLANPADNGALFTQSLQSLVADNPQSGILQVLYARAGDPQLLNKAAIYYNPRALFKLVSHPDELAMVNTADITHPFKLADTGTSEAGINTVNEELPQASSADSLPVENDDQISNLSDSADEDLPVINEVENHSVPTDMPEQENVEAEHSITDAVTEQETLAEPLTNDATGQSTIIEAPAEETALAEKEIPYNNDLAEQDTHQDEIEDEVYEEIVGIEDIGFKPLTTDGPGFTEARFSDPTIETNPEEEEASSVLFHQPEADTDAQNERNISEQEDRLILGGIVNTDYLLFDKKLEALRNTTPVEDKGINAPQAAPEPAAETQEISRYDDDKMPYTFLWWLNKTRKEHAENLQPYATGKRAPQIVKEPKKTADELQHQYFENIFNLTSVNAIERTAAAEKVAFDPEKKEDIIIERFIHTEPQIKPLSADKLDNENKARKSSEDQNDFVTETLARIYTDQALYHKAIATYKKLILKYPEKKLYFAAQIEQLEKKTN